MGPFIVVIQPVFVTTGKGYLSVESLIREAEKILTLSPRWNAEGEEGKGAYAQNPKLRTRVLQGICVRVSSSHAAASASLGARQSPRGLSEPPEPTFGPLGRHERLNWLS